MAIQNGIKLKCFRLKQRSVIKCLVVEKYKPCDINRRVSGVYEEAYFSKKRFINELKYGFASTSLSKKKNSA